MQQDPQDVERALSIARGLIRAGVPVFAAPPCPQDCPKATFDPSTGRVTNEHRGPGHYHLPMRWPQTVATERFLDPDDPIGWKPGWALAAVGGHVADFLDEDPRSGGDRSAAELRELGEFPLTFGQQSTPSGGEHYVIAPTGMRKGSFMDGLDLQSGDPDGVGRGFVFIAPTVRPSKREGEGGALRAYRWEVEPDLELLAEQIEDARHSVRPIIERVTAKRAGLSERVREPFAPTEDDPFISASQAAGFAGDRSFTISEAQDFVRPSLVRLAEAKIGVIEENCNAAAATLSHFVPAFWSADEAMALLVRMLSTTAYDPNGPSDWTVEKFRPVLDGRRPVLDPWKATVREEPPAPPSVTVEAEDGEEGLSTLEKLRRRLVSAQELADSPAPEPLVHGLLDLDSEAWLIGAPGSLKSFVALDLAAAVGRGGDAKGQWQGRTVEQRPVLYIAAEGQRGMVLRTRAWITENGPMDGVTFLPYPVQVKSSDGQWDALVTIARELRPGLIIIDTQARVTVGIEENSSMEMGVAIAAMSRLRRATGACMLIVHHTGRSGGDARGSSAIDGAQDTELKVVRAEPRSSLIAKIVMDKQKEMAEGDRDGIPIQMRVVDLGVDPHTGRALSSLVVGEYDPFIGQQGVSEAEVEAWRGREPEAWTMRVEGVLPQSKLKRRILQVLADHAHQRGLTQAETLKVVIGRWYDPKKKPEPASWADGWNYVTSLDLAVNVAGERWSLDDVEVESLRKMTES